jgi:hypothetical protein
MAYLSGFSDKFGLEGFIFGNKCGAPVKQGIGMWTTQTKHFTHYCAQSSCCCEATGIHDVSLYIFPGNKYMSAIIQMIWLHIPVKNNENITNRKLITLFYFNLKFYLKYKGTIQR